MAHSGAYSAPPADVPVFGIGVVGFKTRCGGAGGPLTGRSNWKGVVSGHLAMLGKRRDMNDMVAF